MVYKSIGIIETESISTALLIADAASKVKNLRMLKKISLPSGITSLFFEGELGALQKVIKNGTMLAKDSGKFRGAHIIPMPHPDVISILNFSK